jgi:hypothetical protein
MTHNIRSLISLPTGNQGKDASHGGIATAAASTWRPNSTGIKSMTYMIDDSESTS